MLREHSMHTRQSVWILWAFFFAGPTHTCGSCALQKLHFINPSNGTSHLCMLSQIGQLKTLKLVNWILSSFIQYSTKLSVRNKSGSLFFTIVNKSSYKFLCSIHKMDILFRAFIMDIILYFCKHLQSLLSHNKCFVCVTFITK